MKIIINNLGAIKIAEFELGDLTIICGANNTGKTYATHATYGFFDFLKSSFDFPISDDIIDSIYSDGSATLSLLKYSDELQKYLNTASQQYSKKMFGVFAGNEKQFENASLKLELNSKESFSVSEVKIRYGSAERSVLQISSSEDRNFLIVSLIVDKSTDDIPPRHVIEDMIRESIRGAVLGGNIPRPFIASAERTGAAIFQRELDFTKNRLIELLAEKKTKFNPFRLLGRFSGEYPIAVRKNVDFIRSLPDVANRQSYIAKNHHEILDSFADIIGGEYRVNKDSEIQFIPSSNKKIRLSLVESSSAVRSLLDIGFYLRHMAAPGDLLMVDEPELNLHPENQRRVARLFARLVNIGIKVFITTHSDYILKELNILIMLNQGGDRLIALARRENYTGSEILNHEKVRVYIAEPALVKLDGGRRRTKCQTLVQAEVDCSLGIDARSFDSTIEEMNRIQDEIIWGGEE